MFRLNPPEGVTLAPGQKIIRSEDLGALLEAHEIVEQARARAVKIEGEAQQEFERRRQAGYQQGLEEGRAEMAERLVDSVSGAVDYFEKLEGTLTDLVMKALRKILGEMDERERVAQVVKTALAVTRNERNVLVRVPPGDVAAVQERLAEIMRPYPAVAFVEVQGDSRLASGGCILETAVGVVDAGIDVQLAAIERSLARSFAGRTS